MSENTSEESNLFRDYKTENLDDNELQSRLYAEIYYESNIEDELKNTDAPKTIRFESVVAEMVVGLESVQHKPEDKQPLESEVAKGWDDSTQISKNELSNQETSSVVHEHNNTNKSPEGSPATEGKTSKKSSSKKHKTSNYMEKNTHQEKPQEDNIAAQNEDSYSKYNVLSKRAKRQLQLIKQANEVEQISDSSDSEESILEVPIPPKPKPPLINLQDSDDENNVNSGLDKNDLIFDRVILTTDREFEIIKVRSNRQDTSFKGKSTDKSSCTSVKNTAVKNTAVKNTPVNLDKNIRTSAHAQEIREDIVLNCTVIQKGARSVSEIKQLSKSAELNKNQDASSKDTSQSSKKKSPQNKSKRNNENNVNLQQEISVIPPGNKSQTRTQQNIDKDNAKCNVHNFGHTDQDNTAEMSCSNLVTNRKRQCDSRTDKSPKQKRQCTVQQNNQNVTYGGNEERRSESCNEQYFKPTPENMRNYYHNSTRGQENFDLVEIQRGMPKDPRMWAILDEDLMPCPPSRQRTRYHNIRCSNCHQDGHQRYNCSTPRRTSCCYLCGMKGHTEFRCPQKICLTCGKQQNTFCQTCRYCRVLYCTMCNSVGHESEQCPDLWRRYHQTIDASIIPQYPGNVMKPPNLLYCCNCAKRGHESAMCKEYRWSLHMPTPAAVTNYTDGPTYMPTNSSKPDLEMGVMSSRMTSNKTSIPQSSKNMQKLTEEHSAFSTDIDVLMTPEMPSLQGAACIPETERNLKSTKNNTLLPQGKPEKHGQNGVKGEEFIEIIYQCGRFRIKNNKEDMKIISKNLSTCDLSPFGKECILTSLVKRQVRPMFLKTLRDRPIDFEVTIGFMACQPMAVMLHLKAMKEYAEWIYDLLLHWLNLPDDEKKYGIDVSLSTNPVKMYNVLSSRLPQLKKKHFTSYNELIGGPNDPRLLFNSIKEEKARLEKHKGTNKQYLRLRREMWRSQVKLLMIVNTDPKPNAYVCMFSNAMEKLELQRWQVNQKLDTATYLKLILLYCNLFVPHTPVGLFKTLHNIERHEKMMAENTNYSSQVQQQPEKMTKMYKQDVALYNVDPSSSSVTPCILQNINSTENLPAINIQQSNVLVQRENVDNISPKISDMDRKCDEIITNDPALKQNCQIVTSLNTGPVSTQLEGPTKDEGQPSTSDVINAESSIFASKQNINVEPTTHLTKKQRKQIRKKERFEKKQAYLNRNIYNIASILINEARAFKLPHMTNAADELQRKLRNQMIKPKHVQTVEKLIQLQKKYQQNVNKYCKHLKT